MHIADADALRMFCDENAAALSRYAFRLAGDQIYAENVFLCPERVARDLAAGRRHPEVVANTEGSGRGWLFITARIMIVDGSRTPAPRCATWMPPPSTPRPSS